MSIKRIQKNWEEWGEIDPLWAVLTDAKSRGNKWDEEVFFQTGTRWFRQQQRRFPGRLWKKHPKARALDFGCGVGRLSRALADHFSEVIGLDISTSMLGEARSLNAHLENVQFIHNSEPHLRQFPDNHFDFINTIITLQHMPRKLITGYLSEFARVLRPGGLLLFQLPVEPDRSSRRISRFFPRNLFHRLLSRSDQPSMEMHWIPLPILLPTLEKRGFQLEQLTRDTMAGPDWKSFTFLVSAR